MILRPLYRTSSGGLRDNVYYLFILERFSYDHHSVYLDLNPSYPLDHFSRLPRTETKITSRTLTASSRPVCPLSRPVSRSPLLLRLPRPWRRRQKVSYIGTTTRLSCRRRSKGWRFGTLLRRNRLRWVLGMLLSLRPFVPRSNPSTCVMFGCSQIGERGRLYDIC